MSRAEPPRRPSRLETASITVALTAVIITLLALYDDLLALSASDLYNLGTGIALLCIVSAARVAPHRHLSAAGVYVIIFCLFHFGLIAPLGMGIEPSERIDNSIRPWIHRPETLEAVLLASLGVLSCTVASSLVFLFRRRVTHSAHSAPPPAHPYLAPIGAALLVFCVIVWFSLVVYVGGWRALFGSYGNLLDLLSEMPLHWVYYLGIGFGLNLVAAGAPGASRRVGFVVFGLFATIAFPLGLRGEVLFPASSALVIAARRGTKFSGPWSLVLIASVLAVSAAAKDVRQIGLQRFDDSELSLNPFNGLMELGSSLRPVVEVLTWEHAGDARLGGISYWAPIERAFGRILPVSRRDAHDDERLLNVLVMDRVGPIGFSPVAEAHYNFGPVGVLCVLFLTGIVLGILDTWPATTAYLCLTGSILLPLLVNVRNSFAPVPARLFVGVALTTLLFFMIGLHQSRKRLSPRAGSSRSSMAAGAFPSVPHPKPNASPRVSR